MPTRLAVIADTHLTPMSPRDLPAEVWVEIERADLVLHAGDVNTPELLERIGRATPVVAVLGNNDVGLDHLPQRWSDTIDGVRVDWPDGFGLIRASNTTPVLVLRFEGHTQEALHRIEAVMLALLLKAKPDAVVGSAQH